jgi:hypothetical protein
MVALGGVMPLQFYPRRDPMLPVLPHEALAGACEMVCYVFTVITVAVSYWLAGR